MAILVSCAECGKRFRFKDRFRGARQKCPNCKAAIVITGAHVCGTDVFISHSTADKQVADAVCAAMESKGVRCWIAPRDIPPGASWGSAIIEGIEDSRVMLLVFSEQTNKSDQVLREIERAVAKKKPVVPLRLDRTPMRKDYEYFLASCHWLDATDGALEDHLATLTGTVRHLLLDKAEAEVDAPPAAEAPASPDDAGRMAPPRKIGRGAAAVVALVLVGAVIGGAIYLKNQSASSGAGPSTQPTSSTPTTLSSDEPAIDLLARFRIPDNVVSGDWKRTPDGIHVTGPAPGRANFGPPPAGDYDLRITFTTFVGDDGVGVVLSRYGNNFALAMGVKMPPGYGFGYEDGKLSKRSITRRRFSEKLENGVKHDVLIRVRNHGATAELDGKPLAEFVTRDFRGLSIPRPWAIGPNSLGFVTYRTVMIHSIECRPVPESGSDGGAAPR